MGGDGFTMVNEDATPVLHPKTGQRPRAHMDALKLTPPDNLFKAFTFLATPWAEVTSLVLTIILSALYVLLRTSKNVIKTYPIKFSSVI